jgi:putative SOS response-associated peptidase YedK
MCGRFAIYIDNSSLKDCFKIDYFISFDASYNVAPTDNVPVIFELSDNSNSLSLMRWGLIPSWVKSKEDIKSPLINARADTILDKPSF